MLLMIQCLVLCFIFTIMILPAQYHNPLSQFASYPTAIRKRVYELPRYQSYIASIEQKNWKRKIIGVFFIIFLFSFIAYVSGKHDFISAFCHVFLLFLSVNLYDLIVFDFMIFCHSKKLMIPGTEDLIKEYRDPTHHIIGSLKGLLIGTFVALLSASLIYLGQLFL